MKVKRESEMWAWVHGAQGYEKDYASNNGLALPGIEETNPIS